MTECTCASWANEDTRRYIGDTARFKWKIRTLPSSLVYNKPYNEITRYTSTTHCTENRLHASIQRLTFLFVGPWKSSGSGPRGSLAPPIFPIVESPIPGSGWRLEIYQHTLLHEQTNLRHTIHAALQTRRETEETRWRVRPPSAL